MTAGIALAVVDGQTFEVLPAYPMTFGRAPQDGVLGLDETDMGISAVAGSIEYVSRVWWVVNRSRKRRLLIDAGAGAPAHRLECGHRFAITVPRLTVLVPGALFTHRIEVLVPEGQLARVGTSEETGTITAGSLVLSERDRAALIGVLGGYLEEFPRRQARPRTYQQAADILGAPWTKITVRKQIERLKERLARCGVYFDGPQANFDLADHLIGEGLLRPSDLSAFGR